MFNVAQQGMNWLKCKYIYIMVGVMSSCRLIFCWLSCAFTPWFCQSFSKSLQFILSFRLGIALSLILSNRVLWVQVWVHMHLPQLNPMISLPRMSISKELAILQNPNNTSPTSPGTAIIIIAFFLSNKKRTRLKTIYRLIIYYSI